MNEVKVLSIDELKKKAAARAIPLPGWDEKEVIYMRVKRPSLTKLVQTGSINDRTWEMLTELIDKGTFNIEKLDEVVIQDIADTIEQVVIAALTEPTYEELLDAGIELTDAQIWAIFAYAVLGEEHNAEEKLSEKIKNKKE